VDVSGKTQLTVLLKKIINNSSNIGWIRLLYLNPKRISDELLDLIATHKRICKYMDLPIQHINNRILKLMNRCITKEEIISLIAKIRKKIPGVCLRTSIIVGFPSETNKEFIELLEFIKEVKFDRLGVFIYSREEGTAAYSFKGQIAKSIKQKRFDALMLAQQKVSRELNSKFLGKTITVLIEKKENEVYLGRSQADAPEVDGMVYVKSMPSMQKLKNGEFVKVNITDTLEYDLVGETIL